MGDLSFTDGFIFGSAKVREAVAKGLPMRIFDWHKAAEIIKQRQPSTAEAGLLTDWPSTGGEIFEDGAIVDQEHAYTYLASAWAQPTLRIDGEDIPCFITEHENPHEWDAGTYWPDSAREILA
jgi:hypothetical protein